MLLITAVTLFAAYQVAMAFGPKWPPGFADVTVMPHRSRMERRTSGRVVLIALLAAACASGPEPSGNEPSHTPITTSGPPSPEQTTGVPSPDEDFVPIDLAPGVAMDATVAPFGWVAVGRSCPRDPGCPDWGAAAWTSPDGLTWTQASVDGGESVALSEVAWTGRRLVAMGQRRIGEDNDEADALVLTSDDGRAWREIGSFHLGGCFDRCPYAHHLSGNDQVLIVGGVLTSAELAGPYRSTDGGTWTRIPPAAYGLETPSAFEVDTLATDKEVFWAGACRGCPVVVWRSRDAIDWKRVGSTSRGAFVEVSIAFDGERLLIAQGCAECETTVWTAESGEPFAKVASLADVRHAKLAFTGDVFVLAGPARGGPRVWTSPDGQTWDERPTELDQRICSIAALVGAPAGVLMVADPECPGMWFRRAF